jgi:hypothetical protein
MSMTPRATLSPAWLGLFALATFGGLVVASFASGYHLVMKTAPRAEPLTPVAAAPPEVAGAGGAAAATGGGAAGAVGAATPADPAEAIVRQNLPPDRALVWAQPKSKKVVGRLPARQRVALLGRQGTWVRVEFKRAGKQISGWTMDSNLQLN